MANGKIDKTITGEGTLYANNSAVNGSFFHQGKPYQLEPGQSLLFRTGEGHQFTKTTCGPSRRPGVRR